MNGNASTPKFALGQVVATPGALEALARSGQTPNEFLLAHVAGDWGELSHEDKCLNNQALVDGDRILSAYRTVTGDKIWVITEADRSSTCILLPEEY
jgi:hypothetical protein